MIIQEYYDKGLNPVNLPPLSAYGVRVGELSTVKINPVLLANKVLANRKDASGALVDESGADSTDHPISNS
jgi:hypothetical protein